MAINYIALKAEIQNDPQTYGYAAWVAAAEPENVAAALNKARNGTDGETAITIRRTDISSSEVLEVLDIRDFEATAPGVTGMPMSIAWFESVTQLPTMRLVDDNGADTRILGNLKRLILNADANGSEARLIALANRFGSRAEQLFGRGTVVTNQDVALALQS